MLDNVDLYNIEQSRNNVANITIWRRKPRVKSKIKFSSFTEYTGLKIFFIFSHF